MPSKRRIVAIITLALLVSASAWTAACGDDDDPSDAGAATATVASGTTPAPTAAPTAGVATGAVTIFAAASLTASFEEIKTDFEAANEGVSITYNFAGSPALRTQLQEGASADIYASADTPNMQQAFDAGLVVDTGQIFARNRLAVIVPAGSTVVTALLDLGNSGVKLVLAAPEVPVGKYARASIDKMQAEGSFGEDFTTRTLANVVSDEPNVKAVVTKVQLGEADAGIVYVTDVTPEVAADVTLIEIPEALNVIATYPIAVTAEAANAVAADAFIRFVLSDAGQAILAKYGFLPVE